MYYNLGSNSFVVDEAEDTRNLGYKINEHVTFIQKKIEKQTDLVIFGTQFCFVTRVVIDC